MPRTITIDDNIANRIDELMERVGEKNRSKMLMGMTRIYELLAQMTTEEEFEILGHGNKTKRIKARVNLPPGEVSEKPILKKDPKPINIKSRAIYISGR